MLWAPSGICQAVTLLFRAVHSYTHPNCSSTNAAANKTKQNLTLHPPPLGDSRPHVRRALGCQEVSQGIRGIGQIGCWFPGGLEKTITSPFDQILIHPNATTAYPTVIKHPFHLKFVIISGRGAEAGVRDRITKVAHSRLELAGVENRLDAPRGRQFKLEGKSTNL